jgi:isopentenyl diphosphate isomerase/L-lactate dehydrogenase-like FMN-dependent dehydrogenase
MKRAVSPPRVVKVEDLRRVAQRRVPRVVFDYLDGGADGEVTLRENCRAFEQVTFRPRHAVAVPACDLRTRVLGLDLALPFLLAPVGYSRVMHRDGECGAARPAGKAGTGYILSTLSGHRLEEVKAASTGPVCYQLYLLGGREAAKDAVGRARAAGCAALVVTIDTAVAGLRERDVRNGMVELLGGNLFSKLPYISQVLTRPRWLLDFLLDGGVPPMANVILADGKPLPLIDVGAALAAAAVTWEDLRWLRQAWPGPIVVKGVLTAEDARRAVDEGAAAVVVSNHGGRQLDCVSPTLRALPEVVAAVGDKTEVLLDGGIRRGSDIVKAICLGARAVLIGRGYAYGLAAAGEAGVTRAIQILTADLERTLRLLGCPSIRELDRSYVEVPPEWEKRSSQASA